MNISANFIMLKEQIYQILFSPFNRLLILACSSQIASMLVKMAIKFFKTRKFSIKEMVQYGGMPSSHTAFITSLAFGIALDKNYGWQHPLFAVIIVLSGLILADTIKLRGTIDKLNTFLSQAIEKDKELANKIKMPKMVAHTPAEVIAGVIFAFIYTFLFYLFLYDLFPVQ
jgi:acid phosphatase family membrane protein YuiD